MHFAIVSNFLRLLLERGQSAIDFRSVGEDNQKDVLSIGKIGQTLPPASMYCTAIVTYVFGGVAVTS
ncbi:MAG: hypothetical protein ACK559_05445, partial [bacterium]